MNVIAYTVLEFVIVSLVGYLIGFVAALLLGTWQRRRARRASREMRA